jgi:hypothetical protein
MNASDNVSRLADMLADPNRFRSYADSLLRSVGVGPTELAQLMFMPTSDQRAALAAILAPAAPEQPPAPAAAPRPADHLPAWRRQHIERQASAALVPRAGR